MPAHEHPAACWCCGEPAPIRGEDDPWEGRLDGYCVSCATTRCDTTDSTCAVKSTACDCPTCTEAAARPGMAQVTHVESAAKERLEREWGDRYEQDAKDETGRA